MSAEVQCASCRNMIDREDFVEHGLCSECAEATQIDRARVAQRKLCTEKGYPHFAPPSGRCSACGKNIYAGDRAQTGESHVTGCWHCQRSYCD